MVSSRHAQALRAAGLLHRFGPGAGQGSVQPIE